MGIGVLVLAGLIGAQSPAATVAGRVTDQASGRPIPRMVVTAIGADDRTSGEALTDPDGRYEIAGLAAGAYAINVAHDEHRATYLEQWVGEATPGAHPSDPHPLTITLAANERRNGVDVALTRALAIEGQVLDPWDDPFPDVSVMVLRARDSEIAGSAATNDLGMYRVFDLAPGRYRVCVAMAGHFAGPRSPGKEFVRTCHPAAIVEADASDLTLAARDLSGVDIRVQLAGERSISGTVTDAAGRPVDYASVSADPYDRTATSNNSLSAGGAFTIGNLAPGRYRVSASIGENWLGDSNRPGSERQAGEADADLAVLETATVAIAMAKAVTVTGTVRFDGTAPPNLRVTVETRTTRQGRMRFDDRSEAAVKDDLTFELVSLYHRPLFVVTRGLPEGWALESVRLGGRDITAVPTDFVAAGGGRLEIVLTNRVASPSVEPVDDRGEPMPASQVIAIPANHDRWAPPFVITTRTKAGTGPQQLEAMLPGDYFVAALPRDDVSALMNDSSWLAAVAAVATKITLAAGDTPILRLRVTRLPDK